VSLVIKKYNDLIGPMYFYNGEEALWFSPSRWLYVRETPDGLQELSGVTGVCKIVDKSDPLMKWAVRKAMEKLRAAILSQHLGPNQAIELFVEELDQIIADAKKADKEALEDAGGVGHDAHSWIEALIKSILAGDTLRQLELLAKLPEEERAANCCVACVDWQVQHNVRWISTERKVYSRMYGVAGTMDGLALVDSCADPLCCPCAFTNRLSIIDWKSSNYLYTTYLMQTAMYQQAFTEETGEQIADRWIIRLGKDDGEFEPWHAEGYDVFVQDFEAFKQALYLTRSLKVIDGRISTVRTVRRDVKKKAADAARDAEHRVQCPKAKDYKGSRLKKGCNDTDQMCQACKSIYEKAHL
jgi:hypothetical protein